MAHLRSVSAGALLPGVTLFRSQPLLRLATSEQQEGGSFGPDEIALMTTAFDGILRDFKLVDRDDPMVEMIAKLIIELVQNGKRDPEQLRKEVVGRYGLAC